MQYSIIRVDQENYPRFDDMVFYRVNGRERRPEEQTEPRDYREHLAMLADKNLYVYAAQVGERFVGWISAVFIPKVGHPKYGGRGFLDIDELWTAPSHRRHGIAYALMAEAEHTAKARGAAGLRLYVGGDNPAAMALYRKFGYEDRGGGAHWMVKEWGE